jgi:PadR family transcriptional regulator PadR
MSRSTPQPRDVLQGTLDLLILRTLAPGPRHGWAIAKRIQDLSQEVLRINQGSLYPALYRLEDRGWISAEWGISSEGRRAKFYRLSAAGRKQLAEETREWQAFSLAINLVLEGA